MGKKNLFAKGLMAVTLFTAAACQQPKTVATDDNAQVVLDNIATRTSVRKFTDKPIDEAALEAIVRAGMAAPSAVNAQPWAFVVLTDRKALDSLAAVHPWSNLKTATAAIVVCGNLEKALQGPTRDYWIQDCSAATENILLAAHALGLGAVWCGVFPDPKILPEVKRVLKMPEYIVPLNIITMGYPAESPKPKDKFKTENIHYQTW